MDKDRIKFLIRRFNDGDLDKKRIKEMEKLIEDGTVDISDLESINSINAALDDINIPEPGENLNQAFYSLLEEEKTRSESGIRQMINKILTFPKRQAVIFRPAYSVLLLILGFILGSFFGHNGNNKKIDELSSELHQVQSLMMITLIEKPSASERLKAIQLSQRLESPDDTMINALLITLNSDENPNIRLAAIEALTNYTSNENVRLGMIKSILNQDLPIVQVALADAMVLIQERRAIEQLKILMDKEDTHVAVKRKIGESIKKLI